MRKCTLLIAAALLAALALTGCSDDPPVVAPTGLIPEGELVDGYRISGVVGDDDGLAGVTVRITHADTFGAARNIAVVPGRTITFRDCGKSTYARNGYVLKTLDDYVEGDDITLYGAWDVYARNKFGATASEYCAYTAEGSGPGPTAPGYSAATRN